VARLKYGGFELLDTQFVTEHLARFGAIEVGRAEFQRLLEAALYCPNMGKVDGGGAGRGGRGFFGAAAAGAGAGAGAAAAAGAGAGRGGAGTGAGTGAGAAAASAGADSGDAGTAAFCSLPAGVAGSFVLQLVSQTSKTGCSTA
jgi:leucyl/phenylalanyl-tRNA--protein transferase